MNTATNGQAEADRACGITVEERRRYDARRAAALAQLASLGLERVPLDVAAAMLPEQPEWGAVRRRVAR